MGQVTVMTTAKKISRFFSGIEWKLSLANLAWGVPAAIASFALPAWAVRASKVFEEYAPLSWVVAGFMGSVCAAIIYGVAAWGRSRWVRASYDARMLAQGGAVDPLEKTFERKRIYLNEFCLPSHPFIEGKAFIDCELIGPANIIFVSGNNIMDAKYPVVDAIYMKEGARPNNGYVFKDCIFRSCNFSRVTFLVQHEETNMFSNFSFVNWLTESPSDQGELELMAVTASNQMPQLLEDTAPETPL